MDTSIVVIIVLCVLMLSCFTIASGVVNELRPIKENIITVDLIEYSDDRYHVWDSYGQRYDIDEDLFKRRWSANPQPWVEEGHTYLVVVRGRTTNMSTATIISYTEIER